MTRKRVWYLRERELCLQGGRRDRWKFPVNVDKKQTVVEFKFKTYEQLVDEFYDDRARAQWEMLSFFFIFDENRSILSRREDERDHSS